MVSAIFERFCCCILLTDLSRYRLAVVPVGPTDCILRCLPCGVRDCLWLIVQVAMRIIESPFDKLELENVIDYEATVVGWFWVGEVCPFIRSDGVFERSIVTVSLIPFYRILTSINRKWFLTCYSVNPLFIGELMSGARLIAGPQQQINAGDLKISTPTYIV